MRSFDRSRRRRRSALVADVCAQADLKVGMTPDASVSP